MTQTFISIQSGVADENDDKHFYESSDSEKEADSTQIKKKQYVMDPDHRLLLRTCKPLLNSRNAAVSHFETFNQIFIHILLGLGETNHKLVCNFCFQESSTPPPPKKNNNKQTTLYWSSMLQF